MQPIPYVFFRGNCREAMTAYGAVFGTGANLDILEMSSLPADARPPNTAPDAVMHAALPIGAGWLYGSDDPTGQGMSGSYVSLSFPDESETRRVFAALEQGGEVRLPLTAMSWSPLFGMLRDRFGIQWMLLTDAAGS